MDIEVIKTLAMILSPVFILCMALNCFKFGWKQGLLVTPLMLVFATALGVGLGKWMIFCIEL